MDHLQSMKVFVRVALESGGSPRGRARWIFRNAVATRHVADLEGRLGTRLCSTRTTRSLSLTESGPGISGAARGRFSMNWKTSSRW